MSSYHTQPTPWTPLPVGSTVFEEEDIPSTIPSSIAEKLPTGYYRIVGDAKQTPHYRVQNRSAPILQQVSPDVPGIQAVSDSILYIPEPSLTEKNQAAFANRAVYLDNHRLSPTGMTTTVDEVLASQNPTPKATSCVRMDPCPDPPFKNLSCCDNDANPDAPLEPKELSPYPPFNTRNYNFRDSSWQFMIDPKRPWDRIAMIIMGVSVAVAILAILILLIWSMIWGGVKDTAQSVANALTPSSTMYTTANIKPI